MAYNFFCISLHLYSSYHPLCPCGHRRLLWLVCWLRGTVVRTLVFDRRTFLSHARPAADGWPLMWVSRPLYVSRLGQLSLSSLSGR